MTTQVENELVKGVATLAAVAALRSLFVGSYQDFAAVPADPAWLPCDGRVLNVADYPTLGAMLGATYGGNGTTTFGLPDHRGRVMAAIDNLGGTAASRLTGATGGVNGANLGAVGGKETHTLTELQMPSHTHAATVTDPGHGHQVPAGGGTAGSRFVTGSVSGGSTPTSKDPTGIAVSNAAAGGNAAHNNVQPTITTIRCILAY